MNKTTKALEKAIDALSIAEEYIEAWNDAGENVILNAKNACKEALESQEACTCKPKCDRNPVSASQEQEPVCWWNGSTSFEYNNYGGDGFIVSEFEIDNWKPLYTHPAQPLSDDEMKDIYNKIWENIQYGLDYTDFILITRAIEQAHNIK